MKGLLLTMALVLGLVFLDQLGLGRSGFCWLMYRGPLGLLTHHCFETPGIITPTLWLKGFLSCSVITKSKSLQWNRHAPSATTKDAPISYGN